MKKTRITLLLLLCFTAVTHAATYRVQVRKTALRRRASAFGGFIRFIYFNTPVRILRKRGGFYQISTPWGRGYVYRSAIVPKKSFNRYYKRVNTSVGYSASAATAATKGFSDAETRYRNNGGRRARYDLVSRVVRHNVYRMSPQWWTRFRRGGKLGEFRKMRKNKYYNYYKKRGR